MLNEKRWILPSKREFRAMAVIVQWMDREPPA
jgi:hypothetical protein